MANKSRNQNHDESRDKTSLENDVPKQDNSAQENPKRVRTYDTGPTDSQGFVPKESQKDR